MIKTILASFALLLTAPLMAQQIDDIDIQTTEEMLESVHNEKPTNCASRVFSNALIKHSSEIDASDSEAKVRVWARESMTGDGEVLKELLKCPELQNIADTTTIIFNPIVYNFPGNKRTLTINYSTQPKVLKQKILLANKRSLPNGDVNPGLMNPDDPAKYLNTEPAWYAIMVVQHDSLKDFVGTDKNNTLSVKYIDEHINDIYPKGYSCTSRSAWANDTDTINQVVRQVVDIEGDSNDYYVAGDINLEWVMYAEIAGEIILSAVTMGASEGAMIQLKSIRAFKNGKKILKSMQGLSKVQDVKKYIDTTRKIAQHGDDIAKIEKNIANAKKYSKAAKNLEKGQNIAKNKKEMEEILKAAKEIDPNITEDMLKNADKLSDQQKALKDAVKTLEKDADNLVKNSDDVKLYKEQAETYKDLNKYFKELRGFRRPQTGNVITRNLKKMNALRKTLKAANRGGKLLNKSSKAVRAGMSSTSAKLKHWLADATLKHGARLARYTRDAVGIYAAFDFLCDLYDKTSTTSQQFSNGIEFKPLGLLSADDLEGNDNEVNYGMWLMWYGNSEDSADDDAAYLQSMDFASKFFYQLDEFQDEHGANCNVDIYVVRPIIRLDETNIDDPKGELFYLFMNDVPWSTAEQFGDLVPNIEDWERVQSTLEQQDPNNKYKKTNTDNSEQNQERVAADQTSELPSENTME